MFLNRRVLSQSDKVCCVCMCMVQSWETRLKIKHSLNRVTQKFWKVLLPTLTSWAIAFDMKGIKKNFLMIYSRSLYNEKSSKENLKMVCDLNTRLLHGLDIKKGKINPLSMLMQNFIFRGRSYPSLQKMAAFAEISGAQTTNISSASAQKCLKCT